MYINKYFLKKYISFIYFYILWIYFSLFLSFFLFSFSFPSFLLFETILWDYFEIYNIFQELYNLKNLNGVFEIVSGLNSSSISRLKKTIEHAKSKESKSDLFSRYQYVAKLTSSASNYSEYREAISSFIHSKCIPYPGIFLQDLTFIEDGNKTKNPDDPRVFLIAFSSWINLNNYYLIKINHIHT